MSISKPGLAPKIITDYQVNAVKLEIRGSYFRRLQISLTWANEALTLLI